MEDLFKHLPAVVYEYVIHADGSKGFRYMSSACERILGIRAADVMCDYRVLDNIIHEEDLPYMKDTAIQSRNYGMEWHWQGRVRVDNKVKWVEFRSNHEILADGNIVRGGIIQDITEKKETAKESELRYQSLVERLPIGIVIHNKGRLVFANAQAY
jgi:PAS domain S-box-containing protein